MRVWLCGIVSYQHPLESPSEAGIQRRRCDVSQPAQVGSVPDLHGGEHTEDASSYKIPCTTHTATYIELHGLVHEEIEHEQDNMEGKGCAAYVCNRSDAIRLQSRLVGECRWYVLDDGPPWGRGVAKICVVHSDTAKSMLERR